MCVKVVCYDSVVHRFVGNTLELPSLISCQEVSELK